MPKIETMYAYVAVEKEPNDEGVVAVKMGEVWAHRKNCSLWKEEIE